MPKVHRTITQAQENLKASTSQIPARYKAGVQSADWATPAGSEQAEINYSQGVNEAIANKSRQKGVQEAGNTTWRNGAINKGANVIAQRINDSIQKYGQNFQPILSAMNAASDAAPAKTRDPMQNIDNRMKPVVLAAIAAKK